MASTAAAPLNAGSEWMNYLHAKGVKSSCWGFRFLQHLETLDGSQRSEAEEPRDAFVSGSAFLPEWEEKKEKKKNRFMNFTEQKEFAS